MFEPHEDRREEARSASGRLGALVGFVIGAAAGWLVWFALVLPRLDETASALIHYGSLVLCLAVALFVVAVIGEWIGSRRRKSAPIP